jgi:hypothetical protein
VPIPAGSVAGPLLLAKSTVWLKLHNQQTPARGSVCAPAVQHARSRVMSRKVEVIPARGMLSSMTHPPTHRVGSMLQSISTLQQVNIY